jgi:hypothetical protein
MERSTIFNGKTMEKPKENGDLYGKIHHFVAGKINYFYGHFQ